MLLSLGYPPFPQLAELCGDFFVFVTFESVDENLWFCHLNETFLVELSRSIVYFLRKEIWNFLGISTLLSFHSLALVRPYDTFLLMTFM